MLIGLLAAERSFESRRLGDPSGEPALDRAMERHARTAAAVRAVLEHDGLGTVSVPVDDHLSSRLRAARVNLVFNTYFGPARRFDQAYVSALVEYAGLPATGGDAACHFLGLSKPLSKRLFAHAGIPTPRSFVALAHQDAAEAFDRSGLCLPAIVKPSAEGEGKGLDERSVVGSRAELVEAAARTIAAWQQPALVEEFMPGREFTVGVIDGEPPRVLPVLEIGVGAGDVYSYVVKTGETVEERCPAQVTPAEAAVMADLAVRAGRAVGCRDYWRVDIRRDAAGEPNVLEVNTLPGLQPDYSDLVKMAGPGGLGYDELVRAILASAWRRLPAPPGGPSRSR